MQCRYLSQCKFEPLRQQRTDAELGSCYWANWKVVVTSEVTEVLSNSIKINCAYINELIIIVIDKYNWSTMPKAEWIIIKLFLSATKQLFLLIQRTEVTKLYNKRTQYEHSQQLFLALLLAGSWHVNQTWTVIGYLYQNFKFSPVCIKCK